MLSNSPLHHTSALSRGKCALGSRVHHAGAAFFPPSRGNTAGWSCDLCCSCLSFHLLSDAALVPVMMQEQPKAMKHFCKPSGFLDAGVSLVCSYRGLYGPASLET